MANIEFAANYPESNRPLPSWVAILEAAKEWGIPPWEIDNGSLLWFLRWSIYRGQQNKGNMKRQKREEAKARKR